MSVCGSEMHSKPRRFLGFDCAYTSLAFAHFTIDICALTKAIDIMRQAISCVKTGTLEQITDLCNQSLAMARTSFVIHSCGVVDVFDGKKVDEHTSIERTICLKKFLEASSVSLSNLAKIDADGIETLVAIEKQPQRLGEYSINDRSIIVEHQLAFYYALRETRTKELSIPVLIDPKLKNKLTIGGHVFVLPSVKSKVYKARKTHATQMLYQLAGSFGFKELVALVPKQRHSDLADAFMTAIVASRCK